MYCLNGKNLDVYIQTMLTTYHDYFKSRQDAKVCQGFEEGIPVLWLQCL